MSIDPEKTLPFDGFIEYLKSNGFIIGVDHYLRLQAILKTFGPDSRPEDLKYILCPIFATDKKEQEQFYRLFDSYFRILTHGEEQKFEKAVEKKEKSEPLISPDIVIPSKRLYVLLGILLFALIALLVNLQVNYRIEKQPTKKDVISSEEKKETLPREMQEINIDQHIHQPETDLNSFQRHRQEIHWILTIAPWIFLILIYIYKFHRKRLVLHRQRVKRPPYVWPIQVESQDLQFLKNPQFFSATKYLRQRLQSDVYRLDVEKTIDKTIEQSGYPAFCYKAVARPPEYLVLINLPVQNDHFARYAESITRILEEEGIFVSHYFYKNNPMVCFRVSEGRREYEDLSVLQTRFRHCRLIMFCTGENLLDPLTGEIGVWEEPLHAWMERSIMTPKPPREWGVHEKVLSKEFILVPATCEGLEALAQSFSNGDYHDLKEWIRRDTLPSVPDTDAIHEMERLRSFCWSKDTFQWLCACAVYPELDWNLTLHLRSCVSDSPAQEEQLLTLMRLPWFREGAIPNNDRLLLKRELDKERLQSVQESIFHVLENNPPPRESFAYDGYCLNLFAHRRVLKRMTGKQLRELRQAIKGTDEDRIIQDYTLMSLLESSKISPLGLILPKALHMIFFRHGLPFFGLKSVVLFLLAFILSLSVFLFIKPFPVIEKNYKISSSSLRADDPNGQFEYLSVGGVTTDILNNIKGDGNVGTDTATEKLTITSVNDDPIANDDTDSTDEDTAKKVDVLENDIEVIALVSFDVKPYNHVLEGFKHACNCNVTRIVISRLNESTILKQIYKRKPSILLAIGEDTLFKIKNIKGIPIIYLMVLNPQSILSGEENITGVSMNILPEKQLDIFQKALPDIKKIGLLFNPDELGFFVERAQDVAKKMDLELIIRKVNSSKKVPSLLIGIKEEIDAIWMLPDITVFSPESIEFLFQFSTESKIPVLTFSEKYLEMGALISLSFDEFDLGRQGGEMAGEILSGKKIMNLSETELRKVIISINSKVAEKLGITISDAILNRAEIIH